jgi:hypothetical protein
MSLCSPICFNRDLQVYEFDSDSLQAQLTAADSPSSQVTVAPTHTENDKENITAAKVPSKNVRPKKKQQATTKIAPKKPVQKRKYLSSTNISLQQETTAS